MTRIKTPMTTEGEKFYYLGHTKATVDDNGNSVDSLLEEAGNEINNINANTGINDYPEFDNTKYYDAEDIVIKDGLLYKFNVNHYPGNWNENEITQTSIEKKLINELVELNTETEEKINVLETKIDALVNQGTEGEVIWPTKTSELINDAGFVTETEVDNTVARKQDILVSGANIKTINGESILGNGDLTVEGGAKVYTWVFSDESGTISQEEYNAINEADFVVMPDLGLTSNYKVLSNGNGTIHFLSGGADLEDYKGVTVTFNNYSYQISSIQETIPTKTSQLENDSNFVSSNELKTINGKSIVGSGDIVIDECSCQSMIPTTWAELKTMRDESKLVPGAWYRITDYVTTTSQAKTRSAGHPFDVIVLAIDVNVLSEEARAARHTVDDKITSIQLNETGQYEFRYKGVVSVGGTDWFEFSTVIGERTESVVASKATPTVDDTVYTYVNGAIDESQPLTVVSVTESENEYFLNNKANLDAWKIWYCLDNDKIRFQWALTKRNKSISVIMDDMTTLDAEYEGEYLHEGTVFHRWITVPNWTYGTLIFLTESDSPQMGDAIPFYGKIEENYIGDCGWLYISAVNEASDDEGYGVIYRMVDENYNDVPYDFKNIQFIRPITEGALDVESGTDEFVFTFNYFQNDLSFNKDIFCGGNVIRESSTGLNDIVFLVRDTSGGACSSNTFGDNCFSNTLGDGCENNTFGVACYSNTFGDYCYSNTFGDGCYSNTFGSHCYSNTFGNDCDSNTFGTSKEALVNNVRYYKLSDGINNQFLNVEANRNYETRVAYNSNGELKMYCEADLIN